MYSHEDKDKFALIATVPFIILFILALIAILVNL
jgi:hypothetical protein